MKNPCRKANAGSSNRHALYQQQRRRDFHEMQKEMILWEIENQKQKKSEWKNENPRLPITTGMPCVLCGRRREGKQTRRQEGEKKKTFEYQLWEKNIKHENHIWLKLTFFTSYRRAFCIVESNERSFQEGWE